MVSNICNPNLSSSVISAPRGALLRIARSDYFVLFASLQRCELFERFERLELCEHTRQMVLSNEQCFTRV